MSSFDVTAIGVVRSSRAEAIDDDWDSIESAITIDAERFGVDALAGLTAFSHVEVVYLFDQVDPANVQTGARHPQGDAGIDAVDGTPVLDVKPYMTEFGPRGDVRQPAWSRELMSSYWVQQRDPEGW